MGAFRKESAHLRLPQNCRLMQKEPGLQGEKGLEKGASPLFHFR